MGKQKLPSMMNWEERFRLLHLIFMRNQNLMNLIKRVHSVVEKDDIEKQRQSQDSIGALLGNRKENLIREVSIEGMYGEWISVDRAHMKNM